MSNSTTDQLQVSLTGSEDEPRSRTISRLVRRLLAFLTATLALTVLLPAGAANATTWSSGGTLTAHASCNRYYHTMSMNASIVLSTRFPNGAQVATRYSYYYVSPTTQQRTSGFYTTNWLHSTAAASTRHVPETYFTAGYTLTNQPSALPSYTINTWGHLKVLAQVGVWNGSSYEYSGWDSVGTYSNSGQYGIGPVSGTVCTASVT